jgi:hypothetical protein
VSAVGSRLWSALNDAGIGDWPALAEKVKGPDGARWLSEQRGIGMKGILYVKELLLAEGKTDEEYPWFNDTQIKEAEKE